MSDSRIVKIGIVGLGVRSEVLLASLFAMDKEVEVIAVCDLSEAAIQKILGIFKKNNKPMPTAYTNYHELLKNPEVEALLVPTSWNSHLPIARDAMAAGKYVGIEVGGASSTDELWQLVHASESTGVCCMMLENCCYGREELLVTNLVRKGLFGELIHCECGYEHDLSYDLASEIDRKVERAIQNQYRNCDLYPTHGLGPIAKILRINRGNRFLSLVSMASKARGFAKAARARWGAGTEYGDTVFNEGDIVTTIIKCANGETITLTHGVSLPRPYSRDGRVQGTKGIWMEDTNGIFIEGMSPTIEEIDIAGNPYTVHKWEPVSSYFEKYDHPIWAKNDSANIGGHGGMDVLALRAFIDSVREKAVTPIDVYDVAAWMSVSCLSEQSIAMGGMPVAFPDYTNGKWINRGKIAPSKWSLDEVYDL